MMTDTELPTRTEPPRNHRFGMTDTELRRYRQRGRHPSRYTRLTAQLRADLAGPWGIAHGLAAALCAHWCEHDGQQELAERIGRCLHRFRAWSA